MSQERRRSGWNRWLALAAGVTWMGWRLVVPRYSLRGKVVLITGASRGLGLVLARRLAEEGARLVLVARDGKALERVRSELAGRGAEVLATPCDVSEREQVERCVREALQHFGRIDVLINNAGIIQMGPLEEMTVRDFEEAMAVHFWGPLFTTLAVLPGMRARHEGRIVNISSAGGKVSAPHLLPYCASKFALTGLSEGLGAELIRHGIRVTTICPGLMRTGSPRNAVFKGRHREEYVWFKLADSLPPAAMSAERAARRIVLAIRRGEAEVVLSTAARLATALHGLFPGLIIRMVGSVGRLLPRPGGIGQAQVTGKESESRLSSSWLSYLTNRAAERNYEV